MKKKVSELVKGDSFYRAGYQCKYNVPGTEVVFEAGDKVTVEWIARVYKNSYLVDSGVALFELDGDREVEVIDK